MISRLLRTCLLILPLSLLLFLPTQAQQDTSISLSLSRLPRSANQQAHAGIQEDRAGMPGWLQTNIDGFGHPLVKAITALTPARGALFASTSTWDGSGARRLLRSEDGKHWNEVIDSNFGSIYNYETSTLVEFADKLYMGTSNWNWNQQQSEGAEIWRSEDGLGWTAVITSGFGNPDYSYLVNLITFDNQIYAATANISQTHGLEIWRSSTGYPGDWSKSVSDGFGDTANWSLYSMEVFSDTLYVGTYNETTGGELWRTSNGTDWSQIFTDGFGNNHNTAIGSLTVFQGKLYAGLRNLVDGAEIWRSADGTQWEKVVSGGLGNAAYSRMYSLTPFAGALYSAFGNEETGMEIWRSANGVDWQQISTVGWGDPGNKFAAADHGMAIFAGNLYVGTWNEVNGTELWMYTDVSSVQATAQSTTTLRNEASGVTFTLPPGAVSGTVTLMFNKLEVPTQNLSADKIGLRYFTLSAQDEQGNPITHFNQRYTIELTYRDEDLLQARADEASLGCFYWEQTSNTWQSMDVTIDPVANRVTCQADHFSELALAAGQSSLNFVFLPVVTR